MEILEEIGLTEREAEIYRLLLQLGESPISAVLTATGAHPQIVYRAIDSLVKKKLVLVTRRKNRKYVSAEHPRQLEKLEEVRLARVQRALPELLALQKPSRESIVRIDKGEEAVRSLRARGIDELKRNGTYYIIGGSGDRYYTVLGERHAEIERKRIKKKVHKKLIAFSNQRPTLLRDPFRQLTEFRFLPNEYPVATSTNIFDNTVAIFIWATDPVVITIESEEIAGSYKQYFNALWNIAREDLGAIAEEAE